MLQFLFRGSLEMKKIIIYRYLLTYTLGKGNKKKNEHSSKCF